MVKFIPVTQLLGVRNQVLRDNKLSDEECRFENDEAPGSFHLGYFWDGELVSIASFHKQPLSQFSRSGYQLRGMATLNKFQGNGFGGKLLNFAMVYLHNQKIAYLWCNARKAALSFYGSVGFEVISAEFDVPGIGPHYRLYVKLN